MQKKIEELTDFYMWMVENDYDHNIKIRVERKAKLYLEQKYIVKELNLDCVIKSVCKNCGDESERDFCSLSCNVEYNRKHKTDL